LISSATATSNGPSPATPSAPWWGTRSNPSDADDGHEPMTSDEIVLDCEERMEKAVNVFRDELRGLRTSRATPATVDSIRVEYYGSPTPLKQLAQISTPDPQQILIKPFDQNSIKDIDKAIRSSDLGMSPNSD